MCEGEAWVAIPGYEHLYEVSDQGNVRGLKTGTVLCPSTSPTGYRRVTLSNGKIKTLGVHQLVLLAFIGPPPIGEEVRHGLGGPGDNRLTNLSYGTRSQNNRDKREHGTDHNVNKTHCPRNHPLEGENLNPHRLAQGHRVCLACCRANYAKAKNPNIDMQAVSDVKFSQIIHERTPGWPSSP